MIDEHHVDDEVEAVDYINHYIRNTLAFTMYIGEDEEEEDCTAVRGSNSMHEFRYTRIYFCYYIGAPMYLVFADCVCIYRFPGPEGTVMVRLKPCFCAYCIAQRFHRCKNTYAGKFSTRTMNRKGNRRPKARYHDPSAMEEGEEEFVPEEIIADRIFEGKYQYLVRWEGYEDLTWHDADTLQCVDMIELYEIEK